MLTITITLQEKEPNQVTILNDSTPIQYNEFSIKRKYFKKSDPGYHRKPIKTISKSLGFDRIVKQEPLLDFHY